MYCQDGDVDCNDSDCDSDPSCFGAADCELCEPCTAGSCGPGAVCVNFASPKKFAFQPHHRPKRTTGPNAPPAWSGVATGIRGVPLFPGARRILCRSY